MLRALCLAALTLGVSDCSTSEHRQLADSGATDTPGEGTGAPETSGPDVSTVTDGVMPDGADQGVESVLFTVSYGECAGFCRRDLKVGMKGATLRSATDIAGGAHAVEEALALDPGVTKTILEAAAQALASPWEGRYGCPDCADQGTYHLEVSANGTVRKTDLDPQQHPSFFDPLIDSVKGVLTAHPGPTSICALAPGDCTPGRVSLVLSLNADGALEPTWYNDLRTSIFLPGCTTVVFERVENDTVTWSGPAAVCGWEGNAHALGFTNLWSDIALGTKDKPGIYRATGTYYEGCTPGKPISQAGCTAQTPVTSNSITITK